MLFSDISNSQLAVDYLVLYLLEREKLYSFVNATASESGVGKVVGCMSGHGL